MLTLSVWTCTYINFYLAGGGGGFLPPKSVVFVAAFMELTDYVKGSMPLFYLQIRKLD
jgi:hypothetical protein